MRGERFVARLMFSLVRTARCLGGREVETDLEQARS